VVREATKKLALMVLGPVYAAMPGALRRFWRPPIHNMDNTSKLAQQGIPVDPKGIPWDVLTTSRFVSYACLGWVVAGGAFWLFRMLGW